MKPKLRFTTLFSNTAKAKFEDVKSTTAILDACLVKGNSKYAALSWLSSGGGALAVLDINNPSRLPHNFPMIRGHNGVIMDFDFYPFNDNLIITASEDASLRLWEIPGQFTEDLTQSVAKLSGHAKKVNLVQFHPSAESIVASASFDYSVRVWDVQTQSSLCQIKGAQESFMSLEWNHNGSQVLTSCRDKIVRLGDPRTGAWEQEFRAHEGPKTQKSMWIGQSGYVVTAGFSKNFGREMYLWNVSNLKEPVQTVSIDQAAGTLYPFYDEDCRVLYLAGKGDGNIRYYEFAEGQLYNLTQHTSTVPQKGIGFLPKRCVDVTQNELMRGLKLTNNTLEFVSFNAMRKSEAFQEDLYPPCASGEPAIKGQEWASGKNAEPKRRSMNPESGENFARGGGATIHVTSAPVSNVQQVSHQAHHQASVAQSNENAGLKEKVSALEGELQAARQEVGELTASRSKLQSENETIRTELWEREQENESLRAQLNQLREELERKEAERQAVYEQEQQHHHHQQEQQHESYGQHHHQTYEANAEEEQQQEIKQEYQYQGGEDYMNYQGQHEQHVAQPLTQDHENGEDREAEY